MMRGRERPCVQLDAVSCIVAWLGAWVQCSSPFCRYLRPTLYNPPYPRHESGLPLAGSSADVAQSHLSALTRGM